MYQRLFLLWVLLQSCMASATHMPRELHQVFRPLFYPVTHTMMFTTVYTFVHKEIKRHYLTCIYHFTLRNSLILMSMYNLLWTLLSTLATTCTLVIINMCNVIFNCYSTEFTLLCTHHTTDTSCLTY